MESDDLKSTVRNFPSRINVTNLLGDALGSDTFVVVNYSLTGTVRRLDDLTSFQMSLVVRFVQIIYWKWQHEYKFISQRSIMMTCL